MAMINCPECQKEISSDAQACPNCGKPMVNTSPQNEQKIAKYNLTEIIISFSKNYSNNIGKNIYINDEITNDVMEKHTNKYLNIESNEKPLVLLNKKMIPGMVFSGIVITNERIHYCTIRKSFFSGIIPLKGSTGSKKMQGLDSIEIGKHDACFGTAYVGHELRINNEILGLVRMGAGIQYDEYAINFLNNLFNHFANEGILKKRVNKDFFE